jgi:acyl dehydratase
MKKYWDQIEIGDTLFTTPYAPISRLQIAQFAAAADEFSPLNLDDEFAKNAGFQGAYAPGLMSFGFVERTLHKFADNMKILSLSATFQRLIWPGDRLSPKGLVLRRYQKNNEHRIQFSIWCENQYQEVVMKGSAICLLFKNADDESKSKLSSPQVSIATHEALLQRCTHLVNKTANKELSKELV